MTSYDHRGLGLNNTAEQLRPIRKGACRISHLVQKKTLL